MRFPAFAVTGVLLLAATPVFASHSSPAEIEQTRQLNLQAAAQAAPASKPATEASTMAMNAPPAAAPTGKVKTASMPIAPSVLSSMTNPPPAIANANVKDQSGTIVGAVQKVELAPDGKPVKVDVALLADQEHPVSLDAGKVSYDPFSNVIVARDTAQQLLAMPKR